MADDTPTPQPDKPNHLCRSCQADISHHDPRRRFCDQCREQGRGGMGPAQQRYREKTKDRRAAQHQALKQDFEAHETRKHKWREDYQRRKQAGYTGYTPPNKSRNEYHFEWRQRNRERMRICRRNRDRRIRAGILAHYGGKCACCGENRYEFLSIDHIDGGGSKQRQSLKALGVGGGRNFYLWLRKQGLPAGYRVLCHNCNQSLGHYGYCPHQGRPADLPPIEPSEPFFESVPPTVPSPLGVATGLRSGAHTCPDRVRKGELNGGAKLTASQVREVRRLHQEEGQTYRSIAKQFSVSRFLVGRIIRREAWAHVN